MAKNKLYLFFFLILAPQIMHASFIEATIGTAVVNDATATHFNPAALTLLQNPQVIGLGSSAYFRSRFTGQATQQATRFFQSGSSSSSTHYDLPSLYFGLPVNQQVTLGFGVLSNLFNIDSQDNSLLRYVQASNRVQNIDFVFGLGFKLNECFAIGAGLTYSYASFLIQPIFGIPYLNIPDRLGRNETNASSWGGDIGFLFKPNKTMIVGFDYHTVVTYPMSGTSAFEGAPGLTSHHYHFNFWTPATFTLSANYFLTKTIGLIGTVQFMQWSVFKFISLHNIVAQAGLRPVIVPNALVPYHFHNSWVLTFGGFKRFSPQWIVRFAATYLQTPATGNYQISTGDSIIVGPSIGYDFNKYLKVDASYAHAFIKNQNINIHGPFLIKGVNQAWRDAVSLKLTVNFDKLS